MTTSFDHTQFHQVFKPGVEHPYDQPTVREIESKRKKLGGRLFVDRVLRALGVKTQVYPPRDEHGIQALHQQICAARVSFSHIISALYYILLDFDDGLSLRSQMAEGFAQRAGLPQNYLIFMKGLWYLDHMQFVLALEQIAHPSLLPEFADDIVTVLVRNAENHDYSLALAYYHAVQPVLETSEALELLFLAKARTNVTQAFFFTRTQPAPARHMMFNRLIHTVLSSRGSESTAARATELVSLPFNATEEDWFQAYLSVGDGRKLSKAKDTLLMRKVVTGRHTDITKEKDINARWGVVLEGLKQGTGGRVGA